MGERGAAGEINRSIGSNEDISCWLWHCWHWCYWCHWYYWWHWCYLCYWLVHLSTIWWQSIKSGRSPFFWPFCQGVCMSYDAFTTLLFSFVWKDCFTWNKLWNVFMAKAVGFCLYRKRIDDCTQDATLELLSLLPLLSFSTSSSSTSSSPSYSSFSSFSKSST